MSNTGKKVAIVGTNGIPAQYGGAETLVEFLTKELSSSFDFVVYCSKTQKERLKTYNGATLKYLPMKANGWQSLFYDIYSIFHSARYCDIIFLFGGGSGIVFPILRLFNKKVRLIVNHGGLNEWEREKYHRLGRFISKNGHRISARIVNYNIVDNCQLQKSIKKLSGADSVVIRYGGDQAKAGIVTDALLTKYPFLNDEYFVSVSRAQRDNNLHVLLSAFEKLPNKKLVIVANWAVSEYGRDLKKRYCGKYDNIIVLDAIYVPDEINAIRSNALAYIHSHSYCGTAPSLVEAMSLSLPIISFDVPTNRETTQDNAIFFKTSEELVEKINDLSISALKLMGTKSGEIASKEYRWKTIADQYADLFR